MRMPDFEKRPGAPAGNVTVSVNQTTYVFTDSNVITVTDRDTANNLRIHPWIRETGSSIVAGATYRDRSLVTMLSDSDPAVGDVLTRTTDGFEWVAPGSPAITQKSSAITGAGSGTATTTSSQLVAAAALRIELTIYNNSVDKDIYLGLGVTAVFGQGIRIAPGGPPAVITTFTGAVNMITNAGGGTASVSYIQV